MSTDQFREIVITDPNGLAFDQCFDIYVDALPAAERKPREAIAALIHRSDYAVLGLEADDMVIAFAIVYLSATTDVGLLEYMATAKPFRNAGLGARLFAMALSRMDGRALLIEVESEREHVKDRDIRIRRKAFYARQGCRQVAGLDYLMPAVSEETPPMLDLMVHSDGRALDITEKRLRSWLTAVYVDVYGQRENDARIDLMLENRLDRTERR